MIQTKTIYWAIDPFAEPPGLQSSAAWAIHALTRKDAAKQIQPIYMVNDWPGTLVPQALVRSYLEKMEAFANDSLQRIIRGVPLTNIKPVQIVSRPFESVEQGARELVTIASREGAGVIVASTRAQRRGSSPFSLPGSFVEALTGLSDLPLLVVNPEWKHSAKVPSILFPTDLSIESYDWFLETLDFTRMLTSKITLFHKITFPLSQPFTKAVRVFPEIQNMLRKKVLASRNEAKRWARTAREHGLRTSVVINSEITGSPSQAILECLKRRPGSVVVTPPLSATFPQSSIRDLMKKAPFPMLYVPTVLREEESSISNRTSA